MNQLNEHSSKEVIKLEKNHHRIESLIENIDNNTTVRKIVKENNLMVKNLDVDNLFTAQYGEYTPRAIIINMADSDIEFWKKSKKVSKIPGALTLVSSLPIIMLVYFFGSHWLALIPGILFLYGLFTIYLTGTSDLINANVLNLNDCERLNFPLVKKHLTKEEYDLFLEAFWDYSTTGSLEAKTYCLSLAESVKESIERELDNAKLKNEITQEMNNHLGILDEKDIINAKWGALNDVRSLSALE